MGENKALSAVEQIELQEAYAKACDYITRDMECPYDVSDGDVKVSPTCNEDCNSHNMNKCWEEYFRVC